MSSKRLFLLDANALLHRAWHAIPDLTAPNGQRVNALYGVMMAVLKSLQKETPDALVACWDVAGGTFRHEAFEAYKAHRVKQEDALYEQIPLIQEGFALLGVPSVSAEGFEADDVIGTLALRAKREGWDVAIYTGDRDLLQLIQEHVSVRLFRKGMSDIQEVTTENMHELFGLTPAQIIDYKMLRGDASDNIPGVKGIGEKGAKELIDAYGDVEGIMRAARDPSSEMTPRQRQALLAGEHELVGLRSLVTIRTDVPAVWNLGPTPLSPTSEAFCAFLRSYGFTSLLPKTGGASSQGRSAPSHASISPSSSVSSEERVACAITPTVHEARTLAEVETWLAKHEGLVGVVVQPGGSMVPPAVWLGQQDGALLVGSEILFDRGEFFTLLATRGKDLVFHGAKEAFHALATPTAEFTQCGGDTQIAAYVLEANSPRPTFESVCGIYTTYQGAGSSVEQAMLLPTLARVLKEKLQASGLETVYTNLDLPLIPVLFRLERRGICVDSGYLRVLEQELVRELQGLESVMHASVGRPFNPASPAQLAQVLFQDLHLSSEGIKKGKTGFSTASSELEKLRGMHPIIEQIEEYRERSKLLSTYILPLPTLADASGRIHTTFEQTVASTGRLSSVNPNLQNIPIRTELGRRIREAFVASPDMVLVSCDYSQIELRIAAALAKDEALLRVFAQGGDIHKTTAAAMWQIPLEQVTDEQRRAAKAVNFGVLYGQGAHGLSQGAGVSFGEAKQFIAKYFAVYPQLKQYLEETKRLARERGYVETVFGRRRATPDILASSAMVRAQAERMAINMPIQGTEADILKLAMIAVEAFVAREGWNVRQLLQVHDELVFEMSPELVDTVVPNICRLMETVADIGVHLQVEAKIGPTWGSLASYAWNRAV
jgi:DNA polymerase-1